MLLIQRKYIEKSKFDFNFKSFLVAFKVILRRKNKEKGLSIREVDQFKKHMNNWMLK